MIDRLRNGFLGLLDELSARRSRRRDIKTRGREVNVLKGHMRSVIVVHPPGEIFQEAVFVLRDDYFHKPGISREALLRQARAAAEEYTAGLHPTRTPRRKGVTLVIIFAVIAAAAVFMLCMGGVL